MQQKYNNRQKIYRTLTIAGSDCGGGAGIQADLKTFAALGCYGTSVITALTAQNTCEVSGIYPIHSDFIKLQFIAIIKDIGTDAIKIGMLYNTSNIKIIAESLKIYTKNIPIVLDPVMLAKSNNLLLKKSAIKAMQKYLFPLVSLITPNLPEAELLLGEKISNQTEMQLAAKELCKRNRLPAVLVKGGHLSTHADDSEEEDSPDCLYINNQDKYLWVKSKRIQTQNTHGTGCTLASAITACLAKGHDLVTAVKTAKAYISSAIAAGAKAQIGKGHGPIQHFFLLKDK